MADSFTAFNKVEGKIAMLDPRSIHVIAQNWAEDWMTKFFPYIEQSAVDDCMENPFTTFNQGFVITFMTNPFMALNKVEQKIVWQKEILVHKYTRIRL